MSFQLQDNSSNSSFAYEHPEWGRFSYPAHVPGTEGYWLLMFFRGIKQGDWENARQKQIPHQK